MSRGGLSPGRERQREKKRERSERREDGDKSATTLSLEGERAEKVEEAGGRVVRRGNRQSLTIFLETSLSLARL